MSSDIQIWITALEDCTERMTPWEVNFLENVSDSYTQQGGLSEKRTTILKELYDKYV